MAAIQDFFSQWWVGAIATLLSLILGIIGIFSPKFGIRSPKPVYQQVALRLIGGKDSLPNRIDILYDGKSVDRLTKLIVIFWNNGSAVLDKRDIADGDPLKLVFDGEVLSVQLLKATKAVNQFHATLDETRNNLVNLSFEYLDPKDGAVIEILHTALENHASFSGSIKGLPKGIQSNGLLVPRSRLLELGPFSSRRLNTVFIIAVSCLMFISGIGLTLPYIFPESTYLRWLSEFASPSTSSLIGVVGELALGTVFIAFPLFIFSVFRQRYPKELASEEFLEPFSR